VLNLHNERKHSASIHYSEKRGRHEVLNSKVLSLTGRKEKKIRRHRGPGDRRGESGEKKKKPGLAPDGYIFSLFEGLDCPGENSFAK